MMKKNLLLPILLAISLLWYLLYTFIAPSLVQQAHAQESFSFLNNLVSPKRSIEKHLFHLSQVGERGLALLLVMSLFVWIVSRDKFSFAKPEESHQNGVQKISRSRLISIYLVLGILFSGSTISLVLHWEYWIFSPYAMYSDSPSWSPNSQHNSLHIYGIKENEEEFLLNQKHEFRYIAPFEGITLAKALSQIAHHRPQDLDASSLQLLNSL